MMRNRLIVLLAGLVLAAVVVARADRPEQPSARSTFAAFPMQIGPWRGERWSASVPSCT
jgi:hypothetical protein